MVEVLRGSESFDEKAERCWYGLSRTIRWISTILRCGHVVDFWIFKLWAILQRDQFELRGYDICLQSFHPLFRALSTSRNPRDWSVAHLYAILSQFAMPHNNPFFLRRKHDMTFSRSWRSWLYVGSTWVVVGKRLNYYSTTIVKMMIITSHQYYQQRAIAHRRYYLHTSYFLQFRAVAFFRARKHLITRTSLNHKHQFGERSSPPQKSYLPDRELIMRAVMPCLLCDAIAQPHAFIPGKITKVKDLWRTKNYHRWFP